MSTDPVQPPPALLSALRRLLRPLIRVMVHYGIGCQTLFPLLKHLYVEVAEKDFALSGRETSDSRITLLTGVHRKDVRRLRHEIADELPAAAPTLGSQVIGRWLGDPAFRTPEGQPKPLLRTGPEGESFESLVTAVSKDVRARVVLDEWLRIGLVEERADGRLELNTEAHVPRADFDQLAWYFGRNLRDHVAASAHNLIGDGTPYMERAVFYDRLTPESVAELNDMARREGMDLLVRLNQRALELANRDEGRDGADQRFTAGVYVYFRDHGDQEPES